MIKFPLMLSLIAVAGISHADLRSEIKAADRKVEKAAMAKDIKGVEAAYKASVTPDFKYVKEGTPQDFKTFLGNFTASLAMLNKITSSTIRIISLKESGDAASGKIEHHMTGTMKSPKGKIHTINWTGEFTEEYRKVGGKWKASLMTEGPQKFLIDGKPVKM